MKVIIHAGHLSLDNGAVGPLSFLFDLARALQVPVHSGRCYGEDMLDIPEADWPTTQELLVEARMLYKVEGVHRTWQNVQTDDVRSRIRAMEAWAA